MCHHAKLHAYRSNHCRDFPDFRFFKMVAVRHLGFLKLGNFNCLAASDGQCASFFFPNFAFIGQTIPETWPYIYLDYSSWRPSAILDFLKVGNINFHPVQRHSMLHCAKFRADRSNQCRDMADVRFFKMAAVRHLGFLSWKF